MFACAKGHGKQPFSRSIKLFCSQQQTVITKSLSLKKPSNTYLVSTGWNGLLNFDQTVNVPYPHLVKYFHISATFDNFGWIWLNNVQVVSQSNWSDHSFQNNNLNIPSSNFNNPKTLRITAKSGNCEGPEGILKLQVIAIY